MDSVKATEDAPILVGGVILGAPVSRGTQSPIMQTGGNFGANGGKKCCNGDSAGEGCNQNWRRLLNSPASRYECTKLELPRAWEPSDSS
jgi:hypothetical protein